MNIIIDTVSASTLEPGDTIMIEGTLDSIMSVEDNTSTIDIETEFLGEHQLSPDAMVDIYGYGDEDS